MSATASSFLISISNSRRFSAGSATRESDMTFRRHRPHIDTLRLRPFPPWPGRRAPYERRQEQQSRLLRSQLDGRRVLGDMIQLVSHQREYVLKRGSFVRHWSLLQDAIEPATEENDSRAPAKKVCALCQVVAGRLQHPASDE